MKLTPLYGAHMSLGAKMFTSSAGYQMPLRYRTVEEEHQNVRERVGMMDLSLMSRYEIKGKHALDLMQYLSINDASKLMDGQLMYTQFCNENGNIMDDVTVWRFGEDHFRVVSSSIMRQKTLKWIHEHIREGMCVTVTDISSALGMISVQGPLSRETLQKISDAELKELKFFHFVQARLGSVPAVIGRLGFSGELGYECYVASEDTLEAWNLIAESGKQFGILPYGFDVLDSLRFEKGFIFFGYEVTDNNNPYECGLEKWIMFDKGDFLGKEALMRIRDKGVTQKLVALEVSGEQVVGTSQTVKSKGKKIGETVAGFFGLTIKKNVAWALIDSPYAELGSSVSIHADGKEIPATVRSIRYYDPEGKRVKM